MYFQMYVLLILFCTLFGKHNYLSSHNISKKECVLTLSTLMFRSIVQTTLNW